MATLPLSITPQVCCWACGITTELSKLAATTHYSNRKKSTLGLIKLDAEKKLVFGGFVQSFAQSSLRGCQSRVHTASGVSIEPMEQKFPIGAEETDKVSTYLFRTENGDLVNVFVRNNTVNYSVYVELSSLQLSSSSDRLILSWGTYRADSSSLMPLDLIETPFKRTSSGSFTLNLEFEAKQTPLYLSFILKSLVDANLSGLEIRSHRKTNFCVPIGFGRGHPTPLGLSFSGDGSINFAIFSRNAESVVLCLYDDPTAQEPALELDLDPYVNRSGDMWHASFESLSTFVSYGYRFKETLLRNTDRSDEGHILLDPYAKVIDESISNKGTWLKLLGRLCEEPVFDWDGDV
ncbi:isoamylase 2, chloroplastic-like [Argentina anserina]|uniref:isoamylase 2, chloroplastic-like n=1 Tax=Argentina anserina TaxID=57926 RepID=UPI002176449A|nr:isoamylase 2, chloroplastic-like [Potentilla anserina]